MILYSRVNKNKKNITMLREQTKMSAYVCTRLADDTNTMSSRWTMEFG